VRSKTIVFTCLGIIGLAAAVLVALPFVPMSAEERTTEATRQRISEASNCASQLWVTLQENPPMDDESIEDAVARLRFEEWMSLDRSQADGLLRCKVTGDIIHVHRDVARWRTARWAEDDSTKNFARPAAVYLEVRSVSPPTIVCVDFGERPKVRPTTEAPSLLAPREKYWPPAK